MAREGVRMTRQMQPDLIMLDLQMPTLDGFGTLEGSAATRVLRICPSWR